MFIKIHKSYRDIVAVCDSEILGKRFEEKNFQLYVKESFYQGDDVSEKEAVKILKKMSAEDATFNFVGEKSVNLALKSGIILRQGIKKIQGVPFALVLV